MRTVAPPLTSPPRPVPASPSTRHRPLLGRAHAPELEKSFRGGERLGGLEEEVLPPDARASPGEIPMFDFIHDTDAETPDAGELLAEAGLDPRAIREVLRGSGDAE